MTVLRDLVHAAMDRALEGGWDCWDCHADEEAVSILDADADVSSYLIKEEDDLPLNEIAQYVSEWRELHGRS